LRHVATELRVSYDRTEEDIERAADALNALAARDEASAPRSSGEREAAQRLLTVALSWSDPGDALHAAAKDLRMALTVANTPPPPPAEGRTVDPMQPIVRAPDGMLRFKKNTIVRWLVDRLPQGMNEVAILPGVTREEHSQLAQLIGYSLSGYSELSYVTDEEYARARAMADLVEAGEATATAEGVKS
jgi:hypothetical protein